MRTTHALPSVLRLCYNELISHAATIMGSTKAYDDVHLQRYRVTLDMSVMGDFDPRQVDYTKVFDLQESEDVEVYVEDLEIPTPAINYVNEEPEW